MHCYLPVIFSLLMAVPVRADNHIAARDLPAGTIIQAGDIRQSDDPDSEPSDISAILGLQTRVAIYENRPVRNAMLRNPVLVERNQIAKLSFLHGPLRIVTDGRALEEGAAGDLIRVMNLTSRVTLTARIAADGSLTVAR